MKPDMAEIALRKLRMGRLDPTEDLSTALQTVSEINRVIAATDTKVGLLLTANGFALTGVIATSRAHMSVLMCVETSALVVLLLVWMVYLAATLRPNLRGAGAGNWFSFPTFPTEIEQRPSAAALADHAWRQASTLAEIARGKYRRFVMALRWSAVSLIVFVAWFITSSVSGISG